MLRRLFTAASALSLVLCLYCLLTAAAISTIGDRNFEHWDGARGRWQPDNFMHERWVSTALSPMFGVLPFLDKATASFADRATPQAATGVRAVRLRPPRQHRPLPGMRDADRIEGGGDSMIRRLFTAASAISLAIAITATVFWVSGAAGAPLFPDHDGYDYHNPQRWFWREASWNGPGGVVLGRYTPRWEYDPPGFATRPVRIWRFMGAAFLLHVPDGPYHAWQSREAFWRSETFLFLPYWQIILTAAVLPVLYARTTIRRVRRLRHDPGTTQPCRRCGYDLRASTDRCPECGTPIPAEAKA